MTNIYKTDELLERFSNGFLPQQAKDDKGLSTEWQDARQLNLYYLDELIAIRDHHEDIVHVNIDEYTPTMTKIQEKLYSYLFFWNAVDGLEELEIIAAKMFLSK